MSNTDKDSNIENLISSASKKIGKNSQDLKNAAQTGNLENLLGCLNPNDAQKIQKILSDKNATNKILSTPQAQSLIKKLLGDK